MPNKTTAAEIMARRLITFRADDSIAHAISVLVKNKISGAPVVDGNGHLIGMLSEKDCMHVLVHEFYDSNGPALSKKVSDLMTRDVTTIESDLVVPRIAELFTKHPFRRLPVVDDGQLIGQISRRDVLEAIYKLCAEPSKERSPTEQGDMVSTSQDKSRNVVGPELNRAYDKKIK